ncbi:MAG: ATP-dependent metallopeptidase FtsH/Yme1/Tma family protein, partial [Gammaproteobacteria bacterium]
MTDFARNVILWVIIAVVLVSVFNNFGPSTPPAEELEYSQFLSQVKSGAVANVIFDGQKISGQMKNGAEFTTFSPETD